jgi:hypothetical protein
VVATDAEADLTVHLEAATGSEKAEGGRAERVSGRQNDAAMVDSGGVCGSGRPTQCEVPGEEVGFCGESVVVGRR